jgi:hypothetical protein
MVVPVQVEEGANQELRFSGPRNMQALRDCCTLSNGTPVSKAVFSDIKDSLLPREFRPTEKQAEWARIFPDFPKNFATIKNTPMPMRIKSHFINRFGNLLPRKRDEKCAWCGVKESSDHLLYQCQELRDRARRIIDGLQRAFQVDNMTEDNFLMVLSSDLRIRIFQIALSYAHWTLRCKRIHNEFVRPNELNDVVKTEVRRFILRLFKDGNKIADFEPVIEHFDEPSLTLTVTDILNLDDPTADVQNNPCSTECMRTMYM